MSFPFPFFWVRWHQKLYTGRFKWKKLRGWWIRTQDLSIMRGLRLPHGHHHSKTLQVLSCRFYFFLLQFLLWISSWKKRCDIIALWNPISAALSSKKKFRNTILWNRQPGLKEKFFGTSEPKKQSLCRRSSIPGSFRENRGKNFFHLKKKLEFFFLIGGFGSIVFFSSFSPINSWKVFLMPKRSNKLIFFFLSLSLSLSFSSSWLDLSFDGICQKDKRSQLNGA